MITTTADETVLQQIRKSRHRKLDIFRDSSDSQKGFLLLSLPRQTRRFILDRLENHEIVDILNSLDPDKSTDLLQELSRIRAKHITERLNTELKEKVELLLSFNPKTAAGIMNLDYVLATPGMRFEDLSEHIEQHEKRTGKFPTILVVNDGKLLGEIRGHSLVDISKKQRIENHIKKIQSIRYDSSEKNVIDIFLKHPHDKVAVTDEKDSILGIIHSDDLLRLIQSKRASDLYGLAGVNKEENSLEGVFTKVRFRWLWLIVNLGTAFLAASVVGAFEGTISKFTLLAVYMPIVAGMGGNAATQTLAVTVRGIVLKEISFSNSLSFISKEVGAGVINGAINGILVALVATFVNSNPMLGLVLAIAMVVNLFLAALSGAVIPLIMKSLGKDPATSATIFITTVTDVGGFFVFLSLAQLMLK